ncbi:MAG: class I SAM-dependent methyltransferase [Candidatus Aenigmarchaeota archaeon]|nr:class I SAM-dependent methyltransferase [Candidatus Aenigmarchaeota archaeon]
MLEAYVPLTGYNTPPYPRILNLGCGECYEATALTGYFGGQPSDQYSDDVQHIGIDLDGHRINRAKRELNSYFLHKRKYVPRPNYEFIAGDARQLRNFVIGKFDVIVARHASVEERRDEWVHILDEAMYVAAPLNLFIGSTYADTEHEIFEGLLERLNYDIILSDFNPHAIHGGIFGDTLIDKYVIFARIPSKEIAKLAEGI